MRLKLVFILALAVVAALSATLVSNAPATTEPAVTMNVKVTVTDTAITFAKLRARRGWGAHFNITNIGKKPAQVDIGGLRTRVLQPGQKGRISASFEARGWFPFKVVGTTSAKQRGWFRVY